MVPNGSFTVAAGSSVERGSVRFSCASGGGSCRVVVAEGQASSTGGTLTVARLAAATPTPPPATPDPSQPIPSPPAAQLPAWLVMDIARAQSLFGGSALDWGAEKLAAEFRRRLAEHRPEGASSPIYQFGEGVEIASGYLYQEEETRVHYDNNGNFRRGITGTHYPTFHIKDKFGDWPYGAATCMLVNRTDNCVGAENASMQYQSLACGYGNIPIVQARTVEDDGDFPITIMGGLLDYSDFWVAEEMDTFTLGGGAGNFYHGAFYRLYDPTHENGFRAYNPISGTWEGSLVGIGHNPAYPDIYRAPIGGRVIIVTDWRRSQGELDVDIMFSNLKNLNNGNDISFAKQDWEFRYDFFASLEWPDFGRAEASSDWPRSGTENNESGGVVGQNLIALDFGGPNYSEAVGWFIAPEALGAFGAKKR